MPSKSVSKSFVRAEVVRAALQTKAELVVEMERMLQKLKDAQVSNKSDITDVQSQIQDAKRFLNSHEMKLGMLVEGSIRRMVMLKKGDEWAKGFAMQSASDAVRYIATLTNQGDAWLKRANAAVIDLLRTPVAMSLFRLYTFVDSFRDFYSVSFLY